MVETSSSTDSLSSALPVNADLQFSLNSRPANIFPVSESNSRFYQPMDIFPADSLLVVVQSLLLSVKNCFVF